jgi:hypothetical protein
MPATAAPQVRPPSAAAVLGPATGRWKYNGTISWWAVPPAPAWESACLSWSGSGQDMSYVPGAADQ